MRAIIVCVDFSDILSITLPYNRTHFSDILVVTSGSDWATQDLACSLGVDCYSTGAFYRGGAEFNKYAALEEGLDRFGRHGWLVILDADVVWPKEVDLARYLRPGYLYTPLRRMAPLSSTIPPESEWRRYPLHRNLAEWAGYCQIFHADDPVIGTPPWHDVTWRHAGGGDSFFQAKWPVERKVRPSWEVLHLGMSGQNWLGRVQPMLDGTVPEGAQERRLELLRMLARRRGVPDPFAGEKL